MDAIDQAVGDLDSGTLTTFGNTYDPSQRPPPKLTIEQIEDHLTTPGEAVKPFTTSSTKGKGEWRVVAIANRFDDGISVVGLSLDSVQQTLARARGIQIAGTLAALAALAVVSWWMIRLGVHPVAAMAETAQPQPA